MRDLKDFLADNLESSSDEIEKTSETPLTRGATVKPATKKVE